MAPVAAPATAELPLYLQMARYTRGSKAVMELRTERFLAEQQAQAASTGANASKIDIQSDDQLITGSIGDEPEDTGLSFGDLLDAINPLQHLPIISTLYRELTGDEIGPAARVVGGAIFGGPVGAGVAIAEAMIEEATGDDTGGHIMSLLNGEEPQNETPENRSQIAGTAASDIPGANPQAALVAKPARSTGPVPQVSLPSLSPEAFAALLTVASPNTNRDLDRSGSGLVSTDLSTPGDISAAMNSALDMYNALQGPRRR